jgi:hypothetical protein
MVGHGESATAHHGCAVIGNDTTSGSTARINDREEER